MQKLRYRWVLLIGLMLGIVSLCHKTLAQQAGEKAKAKVVYLPDPIAQQGWGKGKENPTIGGVVYDWGICIEEKRHGEIYYFAVFDLQKKYDVFEAWVGILDESDRDAYASGVFTVECDGELMFRSEKKKWLEKATFVSVPVRGVRSLKLGVKIYRDTEYIGPRGIAVWANPVLISGRVTTPAPAKTTTCPSCYAQVPCPTCHKCGALLVLPTPEPEGPPAFRVDPKVLDELAQKLKVQVEQNPYFKDKLSRGEKIRVVVAEFVRTMVPQKSIAEDVRNDLITAVTKTRIFTSIERAQLDKVLAELKMPLEGLVDPENAKKVGKMVGAEVILLGNISDRGTFVVINARLTNVETGLSEIADSVELRK